MDVEVTEDETDAILTIRIPKNAVDVPVNKPITRQRKTRTPGEKDILGTFTVKTPMDDGPQTLTMGKEEIKTNDIRGGTLELLGKCGINPELLPAYPDSEGKRMIVAILGCLG
jgi:hypothetical protein